MRKIMFVGANFPVIGQIAKVIENNDLDVVVVNNQEVEETIRESYLQENLLYKPNPEIDEIKFYDKPKSKFYK